MLYIIVTQIDASFKEDMLKHKKDVDSKDVYDIKKSVYHRNLLITRNTKKCVYLEDNRSWLEDAKEKKRCWVIFKSNLSQISTRSLISSNHYAKYSLACTVNWLKLQSWYAHNRKSKHTHFHYMFIWTSYRIKSHYAVESTIEHRRFNEYVKSYMLIW